MNKMPNYHGLTREQKTAMKPLVTAIRNILYGRTSRASMLQNGGVTINFGKNSEARHTITVAKVD